MTVNLNLHILNLHDGAQKMAYVILSRFGTESSELLRKKYRSALVSYSKIKYMYVKEVISQGYS